MANTATSDSTDDSGITTVHYDDEDGQPQAVDRGETRHPDGPQDVYSPKYDIEVGKTIVADQDNGSQQVMWRAEVVWTAEDADVTDEQYLAEHPAEAILGVIEQATGGEV